MVEGNFDKRLSRWFLGKFIVPKNTEFSVFEISEFNIGSDVVRTYGEVNNSRGRVLTLSKIVISEFGISQSHVFFVVDQDFDIVNGINRRSHSVGVSDFANFETIWFHPDILDKYFHLSNLSLVDVKRLMRNLENVLRTLFSIRHANESMALHLEYLEFFGFLTSSPPDFSIRIDAYIQAYLSKNQMLSKAPAFKAHVTNLLAKSISDSRQAMHGHDFIELLTWAQRKVYSCDRALCDPIVVEQSLLLSLDHGHCLAFGFFNHLLTFLNIPSTSVRPSVA